MLGIVSKPPTQATPTSDLTIIDRDISKGLLQHIQKELPNAAATLRVSLLGLLSTGSLIRTG